jgi:hypothetical protein
MAVSTLTFKSLCAMPRECMLNALARMSKLREWGVINNSNDEGGFDKDGEI